MAETFSEAMANPQSDNPADHGEYFSIPPSPNSTTPQCVLILFVAATAALYVTTHDRDRATSEVVGTCRGLASTGKESQFILPVMRISRR
jgi:hypothetical protein